MAYVGYSIDLPEIVYRNFTTVGNGDAKWIDYGTKLARNGF